MRYYALATDYDGTIASDGGVSPRVVAALERLRASGRQIILVTGRRLDDLQQVFPQVNLFDCVVAENGAVLYWPETRSVEQLAPAPSSGFIDALRTRGVTPLAVGSVIVASTHPNEHPILEIIHELGLELQIVFNGDEVMVLPPRVNKGSGLEAALRKMGLSMHEIVAVGNAANDHSFLQVSECSVAVADAARAIVDRATFCTRAPNGDGVIELIDELIATDLAARTPTGACAAVTLGIDETGRPVALSPYGHNILVVGPSSSGKSTFATGLIERLMDLSYQICIIDPEGDYGTLEGVATLGSRFRAPDITEVIHVLRDPAVSLVVNLLGVPLEDRPHFAADLLSQVHAMRVSTGRPHWVVIDETHHLLPSSWAHAEMLLPHRLGETILVTMRASAVVPRLVRLVDVVVAVGSSPQATLADAAAVFQVPAPPAPATTERRGDSVVWFRTEGSDPRRISAIPARSDRVRHLRKYAEGNLGHKSFFFRGPHQKLNLRARNLASFCNLLSGIDDETFLFHLRRDDYSAWFRSVIRDDDMAALATALRDSELRPKLIREAIIDAIDNRYAVGR